MASDGDMDWGKYRLGDFFHLPEGKKRHGKFPGTVIDEYYKRTSKPSDYEVLRDVIDAVRSNRRIRTPDDDCCVIHLRTGDVINLSEFTVEQSLAEKRYFQVNEKGKYVKAEWNQYVKTMRYYEAVAKKLRALGINRLEFSYSLDFKPFRSSKHGPIRDGVDSQARSVEYVQRVKDFFVGRSFDIATHDLADADHDFIYMCNSSFFVPSGGGFSKTIARIVKLKGGRVVTSRR